MVGSVQFMMPTIVPEPGSTLRTCSPSELPNPEGGGGAPGGGVKPGGGGVPGGGGWKPSALATAAEISQQAQASASTGVATFLTFSSWGIGATFQSAIAPVSALEEN